MYLKKLAAAAIILSILVPVSTVLARGERGGGGGERGGAGRGGGENGGFGGGISPHGESGRSHGGSAAMGPFGHEGSGGGGPHPGMGAGNAGGTGRSNMGVGGSASGIGVRPGMGAGAAGAGRPGAGGPNSGIGVRPGMGAGGAGGPASGIGVRPGMGAGGAGGPASGIGVRPGMGAGDIGAPGDYAARAATGTYYRSTAALAAQSTAFRGAAAAYPAYGAAMYGGYPNAWAPQRMAAASVYSNPGYGALAATMGLATSPMSYDYGSNVVAQSNNVYVNGDSAGTPQEYSDQASQLAATGQSGPADDDGKWLPLGVFAIVEGDQTSSNDTFQLAVNSKGVLRGNYHNISSNDVENLSGSVDKTTQRAAWTIGSDKYPVYDAGIANLTKDATPLLVHTAPGQSRQMSLIRLAQPPQ